MKNCNLEKAVDSGEWHWAPDQNCTNSFVNVVVCPNLDQYSFAQSLCEH